jgi:hypothetical protein
MVTTYQTASRRAVCVPSVDRRPAKDCRVHMLDEQRLPEPQSRRRQWHSSQFGLSAFQSKLGVSSLVQRYPGSIALHSPSPPRCRDELVWSRTGRQDGRRRSTNKNVMKHNISQRRATPRVPEVDDRNNEAVAEAAGSKRGPRQQHNLIETSCILHMQSSSFCRRNNAVMLQWRRLMLPFAEENSIFSGSPVLSDCRVLLGGIFLQLSPSPPLMIGEFAVM